MRKQTSRWEPSGVKNSYCAVFMFMLPLTLSRSRYDGIFVVSPIFLGDVPAIFFRENATFSILNTGVLYQLILQQLLPPLYSYLITWSNKLSKNLYKHSLQGHWRWTWKNIGPGYNPGFVQYCKIPPYHSCLAIERYKYVLWLNTQPSQNSCATLKTVVRSWELGHSVQEMLVLFFSIPMTSSVCCSTGVGKKHLIHLNNSLVKVKVITVANN